MREKFEVIRTNELKGLEFAAKERSIDEAINRLPSELVGLAEQLPPFDKKQFIEVLEQWLSELYDDAFETGEDMYYLEMGSKAMPSAIDEPTTPKEGENND